MRPIAYPIHADQIRRHRQGDHQQNRVRDSNQHRDRIDFQLQIVQPHPRARSDAHRHSDGERDLQKKKISDFFRIAEKNSRPVGIRIGTGGSQKRKFLHRIPGTLKSAPPTGAFNRTEMGPGFPT